MPPNSARKTLRHWQVRGTFSHPRVSTLSAGALNKEIDLNSTFWLRQASDVCLSIRRSFARRHHAIAIQIGGVPHHSAEQPILEAPIRPPLRSPDLAAGCL